MSTGGQFSRFAPFPGRERLHRLAEVRRREGVSRRMIAERLGLSENEVRQQEDGRNDLSLSTLYAWQRALNVPIAELLTEGDEPLSAPVLKRAQMLRMMKTVKAILEQSKQKAICRLAQFLVEQLLEAMPELKEVQAWPRTGQRRTTNELGQAAFRRFLAGVALGVETA